MMKSFIAQSGSAWKQFCEVKKIASKIFERYFLFR